MLIQKVVTKCIKQCKLDKDKVCIGCGRHIEEIKRSFSKF